MTARPPHRDVAPGPAWRLPGGRLVVRCRSDDGFSTLEMVILAPVLIVLLLGVVALGRVTQGRQLVDQAAAAAARSAAAVGSPSRAGSTAHQAVDDTLTQAGLSCARSDVSVDTSQFRAGGSVAVTVRCTVNMSALTLAGVPGVMTLTATSRSPLETYRERSLGFVNSEGSPSLNPGVNGRW